MKIVTSNIIFERVWTLVGFVGAPAQLHKLDVQMLRNDGIKNSPRPGLMRSLIFITGSLRPVGLFLREAGGWRRACFSKSLRPCLSRRGKLVRPQRRRNISFIRESPRLVAVKNHEEEGKDRRMAKYHILLIILLASAGCFLQTVSGVSLDHIVGGSFGWRIPPNATFYSEWAQNKTFVVGDKLVFMYTPALQNVIEVSKKDFEDCTQKEVIDMHYKGPTVLEITKPGPHYYYCGVGTHCEDGQKLSIDVSAKPVPDPARDGLPAAEGNASAPLLEPGNGQVGPTGSGGSRLVMALLPSVLIPLLTLGLFV
ncbi:uncharacterized protein LOC144703170 [Wolffia australiana]